MPRVLKIEESKIVTKNNMQVQRVIFSDDRIVYVRTDNGEVYPENTPDKYVDLINAYNASHDDVGSTNSKPQSSDFWGNERNYIEDGSPDRRNQIEKTKDKKQLSKDIDTWRAIDRIGNFGIALAVCGILQFIIALTVMLISIIAEIGSTPEATYLCTICLVNGVLGVVYTVLGIKIAKLEYRPSTVRTIAIIMLILTVIDLMFGAIGIMGIIIFIYAIIALTKVGRYEEWFYGKIE